MSMLPAIFAALSDPVRLEITEKLMRDGETTAGEISAMFDISGPAISRHLSVLRKAGLIDREVAGKHRIYSVRAEAIQKVSDWTLNHRAFWEASLDRLDAELRADKEKDA
ncbi:ArsR/SmtB family transcription factor [Gymnodinialimonas ceratoperidinii]|uniref:Metalloregulator ArsR/SmtB family transcription factor n=1 Tax=Gymnodinialimonas ceratoperidinii TaxID=2856823 RepID=A0A8F6YCD3_9RHOB|nr:metalloregulator ArsR/SmtB family transcription factor [Gymnodinialimonas ceratoperidinii]QXT39190.1 metalloregulator ArsR/SmtB family transcription factor [Gymnodinialimonas ceratoperidinii]